MVANALQRWVGTDFCKMQGPNESIYMPIRNYNTHSSYTALYYCLHLGASKFVIKLIFYDFLCSSNKQVNEEGQYCDRSCCQHNCTGSSSSSRRFFHLESKENQSNKNR